MQRSVTRENSVISYHKLKQHIYKNHPSKKFNKNDKDRNFSWNDGIGTLPICKCLNKKQPTKLAQELGIGATLFLMSTRAMTILFAVLSVMNIPLFMFYYSGSKQAEQGVDDIFLKFSLGNAGSSSYTCDQYDFKKFGNTQALVLDKPFQVELKCGVGSYLGNLLQVGLVKDEGPKDTKTCQDIYR